MRRAIELAKKAQGLTRPNPLVGAVIVKNGKIIGEGYHEYFGGAHAEVNAFLDAKEDVTGATMYVTLEPCSHYGKTPPCANLIIEKNIRKVIVGLLDPNPLVSGKGIKLLKNNGIEVVSGVLDVEILKMNEIFLKYIMTKKPFVILKSAMTLDGKIATYTGDSKWITNKKSREFIHTIRNQVMAIMVGINTVLVDDPKLTTRLKNGTGKDPIRIIVDSMARLPLCAQVINPNSNAYTILATTDLANKNKLKVLVEHGVEIIITQSKNNKVDLQQLMEKLGKRGIDSILLEGGSTLNFSALQEGIVDKVYQFIAPKIIGGKNAKSPIGGDGIKQITNAFTLHSISFERFAEDIMIVGYIGKE